MEQQQTFEVLDGDMLALQGQLTDKMEAARQAEAQEAAQLESRDSVIVAMYQLIGVEGIPEMAQYLTDESDDARSYRSQLLSWLTEQCTADMPHHPGVLAEVSEAYLAVAHDTITDSDADQEHISNPFAGITVQDITDDDLRVEAITALADSINDQLWQAANHYVDHMQTTNLATTTDIKGEHHE